MKLMVGLGNPGEKFKNNRHNAGFILLNEVAVLKGLAWEFEKRLSCELARTENWFLVKPQTFMNKSGEAVSKTLSYYSIPMSSLIVIHDDVDLKPLEFKISTGSSSAGHHGVQDIIEQIGSKEFTRIRVGVGRPGGNPNDVERYVLEDFSPEELHKLKTQGVEHVLSSLEF